jgi:subtilase family serine protease
MHPKRIWIILAAILFVSLQAFAQGNQARSLITQPVNESKLTVLKGNTHPLARPEFDRGAAPADLPMDRMMLVLKRSPEQESALEKLLVEQTDKTSPNYHKWLTPEQFGDQFGPSDSDIQAVTSWLESHGFQIGHVAKGRNIIEFSGNAAQVQQAFHTSIHKYTVTGQDHWANSSDPQIPEALTPVVVGVKSLHNFLSKPMYHSKGLFTKSKATGAVVRANPEFTFSPPSTEECSYTTVNCYALAPYDFATIYNVLPLWNAATPIDGTGQTIAVVGRIDVNIADMQNFRILVGLPAKNPVIIFGGTDPGTATTQDQKNDEGESDLDLQWAGGVAKGATVDFVTSASTNTEDGVDISAEYIIDHNLAPILTYSYGLCEAQLTEAGYAANNTMWQQAAGLGITVSVATGDTGSALCDDPQGADDPATGGLAVNGIAATPYNVAVGGTDFDDFNVEGSYWSSSNSPTLESALGYIPEMAYNDTCTNFIFSEDGFSANEETNCNNAALSSFTSPFGGGGGKSIFDTPKPTWQAGPGVPADGARDLPDVSLFAGDGTMVGSAYVVCQADEGGSCTGAEEEFFLVGGTSASTQVFGAIMALVDQKVSSNSLEREGNPNPVMYPLANTAPLAASCNSSGSPSNSCIFYDVTLGTNAMPCKKTYPNCTVTNGADIIGILNANGAPAYNAGVGYDLATGLGTINAENFVNASAWAGSAIATPDFTLTSPSSTLTIASQGGSGQLTFTVTSENNYSGTFNLSPSLCTDLPAETTCSFSVSSVSVSPGTPTAQFTMTVQTMAPSILVPGIRTKTPRIGPALLALVLSCSLAMFLFWFGPHANRRRLSTALAFVAVGIMLSISACGSSSSSSCGVTCSGGGGTPIGTTTGNTLTLTDAAGTTTHKFVFTLTVN